MPNRQIKVSMQNKWLKYHLEIPIIPNVKLLVAMETYRCTTLVFDPRSSCIDDDYQTFHCWFNCCCRIWDSYMIVWIVLTYDVIILGTPLRRSWKMRHGCLLEWFWCSSKFFISKFKVYNHSFSDKPLDMCVGEWVDFHMVTLPQIPHIVQGSQTWWWRYRL